MLDDAQIARLVQDFYATVLQRENNVRLSGGYLPDDVRAGRQAHFAAVAAKSKDALASNRFDDAAFIAEAMLKKQGFAPLTLDRGTLNQAKQALLRAGIDVAEALRARYEGDFNYEPKDRLLRVQLDAMETVARPAATNTTAATPPVPDPPTTTQPSEPTFSIVSSQFSESQVRTEAWDSQYASQARSTFRLFLDVCGDHPLRRYTRKDVGLFRDQIERLPAVYGKAAIYKNMSVGEIIATRSARAVTATNVLLSQKTIKRHFSTLSVLWTSALARDAVEQNIFTGHRFVNTKRAAEQREIWDQQELAALFNSPIWTGCLSHMRRASAGKMIIRDGKFWLPLIAIFSGLRQEEICQLRVEDICAAGEISYFDINDKPPRKLKNANAVRHVPIHQELINIGFLAHVDALRRANKVRVFPNLKPGGADKRLGHAFSKWFTRYRRSVKLYRDKVDFHSFRHNATTLMHQGGADATVIDHVTGHAGLGETRGRYLKGSLLTQHADAVSRIVVGVDLSHLHIKATR